MGKRLQALRGRAAKVRSRVREKMPAFITRGRVAVAAYFILIVVLAVWVVPGRSSDKHHLARRYMGANTRLGPELLVEPTGLSLEDRLWLKRERGRLVNKYLTEAVEAGSPVTTEKVKTWPDIDVGKAFAVELTSPPDLVFLNQGAAVQLWVGNNAAPEHSHVLAVVPSGAKWLAFLCRRELRPDGLIGSKDVPTFRLEAAPEKPAQGSTECPPPTSTTPPKPDTPEGGAPGTKREKGGS